MDNYIHKSLMGNVNEDFLNQEITIKCLRKELHAVMTILSKVANCPLPKEFEQDTASLIKNIINFIDKSRELKPNV